MASASNNFLCLLGFHPGPVPYKADSMLLINQTCIGAETLHAASPVYCPFASVEDITGTENEPWTFGLNLISYTDRKKRQEKNKNTKCKMTFHFFFPFSSCCCIFAVIFASWPHEPTGTRKCFYCCCDLIHKC